ncbi:putative inorganic phosphate cotransporter isoform X2 [Brevipalpus obovatus]|uniref:putative inorganic phosphate cotransporter isoform X2 n=1 Tax=Brevipalpus obovatus TaxID=246614 RepID=UPI003D9DD744
MVSSEHLPLTSKPKQTLYVLETHDREAKKRPFQVRYVFVILGFLGFNILYSLRVNLSVAIVSMVNMSGNSSETNVKTECYNHDYQDGSNLTLVSSLENREGFQWDSTVQSYVLGSFFIGYVIPQIPAGQLAEKFGSKRILATSILMASIFTLLGPMAARIHYSVFIVCRIFTGLSEGVFFPSMHAMVAKWLPKSERSFLTSIIYSGSQIGTMLTMAATGYLNSWTLFGGWPAAFYIFGMFGLVWFVLWTMFVYETPQDHPSISPEELALITAGQAPLQINKSSKTPWGSILSSSAVWAIVIAHFGQNWGFYTLLFELPTYLKTILGLDIKQNGLISGMPYLLQAGTGWISGYFLDRQISGGRMSVTAVRKFSNTIGLIGPALCVIGLTFAKCDYAWSVVMLFLAMALNGFTYSGFNINHVDIAPDYAGTLMGITNCIANFAGILAPAYVGVVLQDEISLKRWSYIFYTSAMIYTVTSAFFVFLGTAELQPWGLARSKPSKVASTA